MQKAAPTTPVLVCETLPSHVASLETVTAINQAVDEAMAGFPNAHRVKTYAGFLNADGTMNTALFLDGTHPNPAGYTVWQGILAPELAKYSRH
jgi:lysophospholipase L1-like esterase